MKPAYFIIWFSFNINFRFSIKLYSGVQKVIQDKYVKYTCSMETVQQYGRFTLFSSKFHSNIYSILFVHNAFTNYNWSWKNWKISLWVLRILPWSSVCAWRQRTWGFGDANFDSLNFSSSPFFSVTIYISFPKYVHIFI